MAEYKAATFHLEVNINDKNASDIFNKYRDCLIYGKTFEHEGYNFLVSSLMLENNKLIIYAVSTGAPTITFEVI